MGLTDKTRDGPSGGRQWEFAGETDRWWSGLVIASGIIARISSRELGVRPVGLGGVKLWQLAGRRCSGSVW